MSFDENSDLLTEVPDDFFSLKATNIDGEDVNFDKYRTKKAIIVVNVASACGYTNSNYKGLVDLYSKYKDLGLEILGFPCNQFMSQEKKPESEIKRFVQSKYNVKFPMFAKIDVNGPETHPVFKYLRFYSDLNKNGYCRFISWNFTKFLLNRNGKVVGVYKPREDPKVMEQDIKTLLEQ